MSEVLAQLEKKGGSFEPLIFLYSNTTTSTYERGIFIDGSTVIQAYNGGVINNDYITFNAGASASAKNTISIKQEGKMYGFLNDSMVNGTTYAAGSTVSNSNARSSLFCIVFN